MSTQRSVIRVGDNLPGQCPTFKADGGNWGGSVGRTGMLMHCGFQPQATRKFLGVGGIGTLKFSSYFEFKRKTVPGRQL